MWALGVWSGHHVRLGVWRGDGARSCRRLLQLTCAGLRFVGELARSMRPVALRTDRGTMWSTLSAPGNPHNQQRSDALRICSLMRRQGLPFLPCVAAIAVGGLHEA